MKQPVIDKQPNSMMCFVCGLENDVGLKTAFYRVASGELVALFHPRAEHQSYPGRMHGGLTAAVLDEAIGRAVMGSASGEAWGVTVEFTAKFRKPVPLDTDLRAVCRIVKDGGRFFEGTGEVLLPDGSVAVEGRGRYIKMPLERIVDGTHGEHEWQVVHCPEDPRELEVGGSP